MSIYVGTSEIKNIYVGTTPVKEVYVGTTKVRPSGYTPTNLIAHWKFNGNYNDETGNFNAAANSGGTRQTLPGSTNKYIQFSLSSSDSYVAYVSNNLWTRIGSTVTDLTHNRWWYYTTQPYSGSYSNFEIIFIQGSGSSRNSRVGYGREGGGLYLGIDNGNNWGYDGYAYQPTTNTWHNMIYTYNKTTRVKSYYVDGVLRGTATASSNYNTSTGQVKCNLIHNNYSSNTFAGGVSEYMIENKVMTAAEVSLYYNSTKANYGL